MYRINILGKTDISIESNILILPTQHKNSSLIIVVEKKYKDKISMWFEENVAKNATFDIEIITDFERHEYYKMIIDEIKNFGTDCLYITFTKNNIS